MSLIMTTRSMLKRPLRTWLAVLTLLGLVVLLWPRAPARQSSPTPANGTRLVVLLVVDQMRYDYLERFAPVFHSGFQRLLQGASFTHAHHAHSNTVTGTGHATLATGMLPRHHGIVGNSWFDRKRGKKVGCVDDAQDEISPRTLLTSSLGDWLKESGPAKVYALSGKDRSAVFLGGRNADAALWYDEENGDIVTSPYYHSEPPEWLETFNDAAWLDAAYGRPWEALEVEPSTLRELQLGSNQLGPLLGSFPHALGGMAPMPDWTFYEALFTSPLIDETMVRLAEHLVTELQLGSDASADLLAISFSGLDAVGHEYGPNSREVLDMLMHLDLTIGRLLDFLDSRIGLQHVVVALSSDHGVVPIPEEENRHGRPGKRMGSDELKCLQSIGKGLPKDWGKVRLAGEGLYLDRKELNERGIDAGKVERELADRIEQCPSVVKVWTSYELKGAQPPADPVALLYWNAFNAERSPDLTIQFEERFLETRAMSTSHGTPYEYDTHVPLVVLAPGCPSSRIDRPVRTADLAPTLAVLAGAQVPEHLDGEDLSPHICRADLAAKEPPASTGAR